MTCSCGIEPKGIIKYIPIVKESLHHAQAEKTPLLIVQRHGVYAEPNLDKNIWYDYHNEMQNMHEHVAPVPLPSNSELYILYTSGTTG